MTPVYTRTGDKGTTTLIGGKRAPKSHLRLDCYGTIDELNAFVGKLKVLCFENKKKDFRKIAAELGEIQSHLFGAGTMLATPPGREWEGMPSVGQEHIDMLEKAIDLMSEKLEPIKDFVTAGTNLINAEAHICRTVCRRVERILCNSKGGIPLNDFLMAYINRLSDYFFVLSRYAEHLQSKTAT